MNHDVPSGNVTPGNQTPRNVTPLHGNDDDVRGAFRDLTAGLSTPVTDIVTASTVRGRELRRRRTIIRVVTPLAVAAVIAPLALAASGSLSLPDLGSRESTVAGPSVTVLDPGTPAPTPEPAPATDVLPYTGGTEDDDVLPSTGVTEEDDVLPATSGGLPGTGGDFSFAVAEGDPVLKNALAELFGIEANVTHVDMAAGTEGMFADMEYKLNHGGVHTRTVSVQVDDGTDDGVAAVRVVLTQPASDWTWESWVAEDGPCTDCVVDENGALLTYSETVQGEKRNYGMWVTPSGHRVDVLSSTADGALSLGASITREDPLLTVEQVGQLAQWAGWWA